MPPKARNTKASSGKKSKVKKATAKPPQGSNSQASRAPTTAVATQKSATAVGTAVEPLTRRRVRSDGTSPADHGGSGDRPLLTQEEQQELLEDPGAEEDEASSERARESDNDSGSGDEYEPRDGDEEGDDEGDGEDVGIEEDDDDGEVDDDTEEDNAPKKRHKRRRSPDPERESRPTKKTKRAGAGGIQFSTTAAEPIRSNLTPHRGQSSSAQHRTLPPRVSLTTPPQPLHRAAATHQATPSPQPSSPPHTPSHRRPDITPFTPFHIVHSGTRPRAKDASPATQSLLVHTNAIFRVYLSTHNAFPDDNTVIQEVAAAFREACQEAKAARRSTRFQRDSVYAEYIQDVVKQRCSQLRGELKTLTQHLVVTEYHLDGLHKVQLAERVDNLLERGRFAFRNVDDAIASSSIPPLYP